MADYKTHLTGGVVAGVVVALGAAWFELVGWGRVPFVALAGVVGGIAPDVDSDSGRPQRILFNYGMVVVPSAILWRVLPMIGEDPKIGVVVWIAIALMRFPAQWLFAKYTVHRGMFHSVPAGIAFGCLCFLVADWKYEQPGPLIAMGLAGGIGYFVHLALDEMWSVDFEGRKIRVKKSLGTALKFLGSRPLYNVIAWALVAVLVAAVGYEIQGPLMRKLEAVGLL